MDKFLMIFRDEFEKRMSEKSLDIFDLKDIRNGLNIIMIEFDKASIDTLVKYAILKGIVID